MTRNEYIITWFSPKLNRPMHVCILGEHAAKTAHFELETWLNAYATGGAKLYRLTMKRG